MDNKVLDEAVAYRARGMSDAWVYADKPVQHFINTPWEPLYTHPPAAQKSRCQRGLADDCCCNPEACEPAAPVQAAPQEGEALPSDGAYMIVYDDQDMHPETFARNGARDAAMHRFEQISGNWNAHLYAKIRSNCRDVDVPDALAAHPSACELGAWNDAIEAAASEAEHWQARSGSTHECGDYIAGAIRSMKRAALQHRGDSRGGEGS